MQDIVVANEKDLARAQKLAKIKAAVNKAKGVTNDPNSESTSL